MKQTNQQLVLTLAVAAALSVTACGKKEAKKDAAVAENSNAPAIIYDAGGKFDKSFNESGFKGAEDFKKETGKSYTEYVLNGSTDLESILRKLSQRGANPVVTMGMSSATPLEKVAKELPNNHFVIVDSEVKAANVKTILFREDEGSFLVGALAAMKSTSGKVGFIGGMDIPVINRFACGFEQGAKFVNPKAVTLKKFVSSSGNDAWNNPTKGGELAKGQFDEGVDVIFAAAGATGNGVYQAAKDAKKFAIGVDQNQNHLFPGTMLTSMVKRVDVAVANAFKEGASGGFKSGTESLGLAQNGVDWALDEHNRALVTPEMEAKVKQIKADIIAGKVKVACQ